MTDKFHSQAAGLTARATSAFAITPDNGADLPAVARALYVGVSGNLAVTMQGGETVTFTDVMAGSLLPLRPARAAATGTTAQNLGGPLLMQIALATAVTGAVHPTAPPSGVDIVLDITTSTALVGQPRPIGRPAGLQLRCAGPRPRPRGNAPHLSRRYAALHLARPPGRGD